MPARFAKTTPQKFDSYIRTATSSLLALSLVGAVIYLSITVNAVGFTPFQAGVFGWAGVVVGFYFGGHIANNTAVLEEGRLSVATLAAEAAAVRAEAASGRANGGENT